MVLVLGLSSMIHLPVLIKQVIRGEQIEVAPQINTRKYIRNQDNEDDDEDDD